MSPPPEFHESEQVLKTYEQKLIEYKKENDIKFSEIVQKMENDANSFKENRMIYAQLIRAKITISVVLDDTKIKTIWIRNDVILVY